MKHVAFCIEIHKPTLMYVDNSKLTPDITGKSKDNKKDPWKLSAREIFNVERKVSGVDPKHNTDGSIRLSQYAINLERAKVLLNIAEALISIGDKQALKEQPIYHLWWRSNDIWDYELRTGNPPPDSERPKFLRRMRLEVDLGILPDYIKNALYPDGALDQAVKAAMEKCNTIVPNDNNYTFMKIKLKHRIADKIRDNFFVSKEAMR